MQVEITLLSHSGFIVRTKAHTLIFDYWERPGPDARKIDPASLAGENVIVFVSHAHGDHYSPGVLAWRSSIPGVRYVFSDDIAASDVLSVGPGQQLTQPDFSVLTLDSTDEGVAFLIDIDGLRIYHGGDHNWWYWEGEPEAENMALVKKYTTQLDLLPPAIDLAFVPVDPRLEAHYAKGIDYLMSTHQVAHAVPMHMWGKADVVRRLAEEPQSAAYRHRLVSLTLPGQTVTIDIQK